MPIAVLTRLLLFLAALLRPRVHVNGHDALGSYGCRRVGHGDLELVLGSARARDAHDKECPGGGLNKHLRPGGHAVGNGDEHHRVTIGDLRLHARGRGLGCRRLQGLVVLRRGGIQARRHCSAPVRHRQGSLGAALVCPPGGGEKEREGLNRRSMEGRPHATAGGPIVQLDEETVNRIAAGEVIVRPSSALKELLENSLDAGARSITVSVSGGGLKCLEIADDGHGIRATDLPLACERFATSKLSRYEDLQRIGTFGFRGEALASISHVARVTITTMTSGARSALRAYYLDGRLAPEPGQATADPTPCARTVGTTVSVVDLFYNAPGRRRAMRPPAEEFARILDVRARGACMLTCYCPPRAAGELSTTGVCCAPDPDSGAGDAEVRHRLPPRVLHLPPRRQSWRRGRLS